MICKVQAFVDQLISSSRKQFLELKQSAVSNDGRAGIGVVWQYQIDTEWAFFGADANVFMIRLSSYTELLAGGLARVELAFGGTSRVIDLAKSTQTKSLALGVKSECRLMCHSHGPSHRMSYCSKVVPLD